MIRKTKEIIFDKYNRRGAYHWQGISKNVFYSNAFLKARYQVVLNQIPVLKSRERLLDIGCGDGALSYLIKTKKGGEISGIDPSSEAIKIAQSKFRKLNIKICSFNTGSGYELPFKSNSFDYIVLADVIEHVNYPEKVLKEVKRVLNKKGISIISSVIKLSNIPEDKMHTEEYTCPQLEEMLKKYFSRVEIRKSHPIFLKTIHNFCFKVGRYFFQPFKYIINILTILGVNPFLLNIGNNFSCQTAICKNN